MPYLSFISDEDLFSCISELHNTYIQCQREFTTKDFYKNKVDPIKFQFDIAFNGINEEDYIKAEITRQVDKTISNAIGVFHQNLLGCIEGMNDLGIGNGCDLQNDEETIFAELKNKHNTMNSSSSEATIQKLINFADSHPDATCYLIQIIARRSFNKLWQGSFNNRHYSHPRVRIISADNFYELVTGIPDAFYQLCSILPSAIRDYLDTLPDTVHERTISSSVYSELNQEAQLNDRTLIEQIMKDNFRTYLGFNQ